MSAPDGISDRDQADLVALADDRLAPERRAALEARLAHEPALTAALERQRAGRDLVAAAVAETYAPHDLRLRIDRLATAPPARRRRRRLMWLPVAALAGAAAAAFVIATSGGGITVSDTLAAALRPPVAAAALDPVAPALLKDEVDGVRFPNYAEKFGLEPVGVRTDTIDGRDTRTVFYEAEDGSTIAYTIVEGEALPEPDDGTTSEREGTQMRTFTDGDRTVVTWERNGRTCVLSSTDVPADKLEELAAWRAKGAIDF